MRMEDQNSDGFERFETNQVGAHLYEWGPDAQTDRDFHSLTNKQRRVVHTVTEMGPTAKYSQVAEEASVSKSYVPYVMNNFPHVVNDRLGRGRLATDGGEKVFTIELSESQVWELIRDAKNELSNEIFRQTH